MTKYERGGTLYLVLVTLSLVLSETYGISTFALLVVAGLDLRFGWGRGLPSWVEYLCLGLALLGNGLATWAMTANAFFAFSVGIQTERGQTVATRGPYRIVRHPGYVGAALFALGTALLLGSTWSLIPAAVLLLVVRTALEDRTLRTELPGYVEYSGRTRFRLIPGVCDPASAGPLLGGLTDSG